MKKERYTFEPEPVLFQRYGGYIHVTVASNAVRLEEEPQQWEADTHRFWVPEGELDLAMVQAGAADYLHYVPLRQRQAGKDRAQQMLDELRNACPVVPVPTYRTGAAVCNRPADQVKLLGGLQLGGLPYYELASGEVVSLSVEELRAIAADITAAEVAMQQAKQACWAAIDSAWDEAEIERALADLAAALARYQ